MACLKEKNSLKSVDRRRMSFQGLVIHFLTCVLPISCSIVNYYIVNDMPLSSNLTCQRYNQYFIPCGTLEWLQEITQYSSSRIFFLDHENTISTKNIQLQFSSLEFVELKAWNNTTNSAITCRYDFSASFINVEKVIINSINFNNCGKSAPIIKFGETSTKVVKLIKIINSRFIGSSHNSVLISTNVVELQVTDSIFNKGKTLAVDFEDFGVVSNITFRNVNFSHNEDGLLKYWATSHRESFVVISDCIFKNNILSNLDPLVIDLLSVHSVTLVHSIFIENFAQNVVRTSNVIETAIVGCYFESNIAVFDVVLNVIKHIRNSSFITVRNTEFRNNTNMNRGNSLYIDRVFSTEILNCTFIINKPARKGNSPLKIINSHEIVISQTALDENQVKSEGGALYLRNFNVLIIDFSNFTSNVAENGGAIAIKDSFLYANTIIIQNCIFSNNRAKSNGGAVQIHSRSLMVMNSQFFNNFALKGDGGALNVSGSLFINSSVFFFNKAINGGGVSMYQGHAIIRNATFNNNLAKIGNGGAIANIENVTVIVSNCTFIKNSAPQGKGGAFYIISADVTVSFSVFTNNSAQCGGALHVAYNTGIMLCQSIFTANHADITRGGAIHSTSVEVDIFYCTFQDNIATTGGGAVSAGVVSLTIQNSAFHSNKASEGAGLEMLDGQTTIHNSQFTLNTVDRSIGGGGGAVSVKGDKLELHNCTFYDNSVLQDGGKGGAVYVISLSSLIWSHNTFTRNSANDGGAVYIQNTHRAVLWECTFKWNQAKWSGGALVMSKHDSEVFLLAYCDFLGNTATHGGALALNASAAFPTLIYSCSNHTDWLDQNIAEALFCLKHNSSIQVTTLDGISYFNFTIITNCTFSGNKLNSKESRGGAIAIQGIQRGIGQVFDKSTTDRIIIQNCTFTGNNAGKGGGIYCNASRIFVKDTTFQQNSAKLNGGGISLNASWMCLEGEIHFISNEVTCEHGRGGAIYSDQGYNSCKTNSCPIVWTNQTKMRFTRNTATVGPILYGGMLDRCDSLPGKSIKTSLERFLLSSMDRYKLSSKAITSPRTNFCFKDNCSTRRRTISSIFPGQSFTLNIGCVDQLMQPFNNCLVQSEYNSTDFELGTGESKRHINGYDIITFLLNSNQKGATILKMIGKIHCTDGEWNKLEIIVHVDQCPLGFQLDNKKCGCDKRLLNTTMRIECSIDKELLILNGIGWLSYEGGLLRTHSDCPLDYCFRNLKYISVLEPDSQCANNHGGILCGGCVANHSVVLGSWKCMECSHSPRYNFVWLTVVMAIAGVILVVFLSVFKITVSSGTINGLIFYANVLSFGGLLDTSSCSLHPILHVFISWINLDLGIEVCFYSGMDVYQKTWLQFVFPIYIWFLVVGIIVVCHYSSTVMKIMGMRNIEVLATLFLLSYAKLLKTIVTVFSVTSIMVASASNTSDQLHPHQVWVYDGRIDYLGSKHLPLFVVAVLFLFLLFLPYTLFLLFGQWLQHVPRKRGIKWMHSTFISTIMDAYHAPYTKHHRYWTGLGLLIRCCLFTIFGTSYSIRTNLTSIAIAVVILLVIRLASTSQLYNNKIVGLLELFCLCNLGILAVVLLCNLTLCTAKTVSASLLFVAFSCMLLVHLYQEIEKSSIKCKNIKHSIYKCFAEYRAKSDTQDDDNGEVLKLPQGTSTTSYFNLRESLIDSSM